MKCRKGSERIEYRIDSGTQENIALMLHDARILAVRISGREFGIKDVEIDLDSRGAISSARRLILGACSILHMDSLENCWWMGESIQKSCRYSVSFVFLQKHRFIYYNCIILYYKKISRHITDSAYLNHFQIHAPYSVRDTR